jgi:hypothetical protein
MLGIQSQDILYDTEIMLCRSLTIYRLVRNVRGFPAIFGVAYLAVSAAIAAVYESSPGAMQPIAAEVAHACLDVAPHGIGSAVVALIFSMAKREVTFLSGTAAIRRL